MKRKEIFSDSKVDSTIYESLDRSVRELHSAIQACDQYIRHEDNRLRRNNARNVLGHLKKLNTQLTTLPRFRHSPFEIEMLDSDKEKK